MRGCNMHLVLTFVYMTYWYACVQWNPYHPSSSTVIKYVHCIVLYMQPQKITLITLLPCISTSIFATVYCTILSAHFTHYNIQITGAVCSVTYKVYRIWPVVKMARSIQVYIHTAINCMMAIIHIILHAWGILHGFSRNMVLVQLCIQLNSSITKGKWF